MSETGETKSPATAWRESLDFEEQAVIRAAKRCGLQWTPWMGDWFVSWSPRNGNNNAEGSWEHWVNLALGILNDPLTAVVAPETHAAAKAHLPAFDNAMYADTERSLTDDELAARFRDDS